MCRMNMHTYLAQMTKHFMPEITHLFSKFPGHCQTKDRERQRQIYVYIESKRDALILI